MKIPIPGVLISGPSGKESIRLQDPLGNGAFGVVFKGTDIHDKAVYAVKFPQFVFFGGQIEMTAFLNEVQAAQEIQHPNVVRVLHVETSTTDLPPYLVMEFIEGGTLKSRLDSLRRADTSFSLELLQYLTNGLIAGITAINQKMLHRDLKPDNILMDGNNPKISDFGLAKIVDSATRSRTFKGGQHILYMAPEGWKNETNLIQIDMYSMGIILFEIASLRYPYQLPPNLTDLDALRDMHLFQQPMSLQKSRTDLPIGFCHVIARLLEKNPNDRFSDWLQVKEALNKAWSYVESEDASPGKLVTTLLHETARLHDIQTQARLEEEKRVAEQRERQQLDEFQQEKLLNAIRSKIAEFNEQSILGEIKEEKVQHGNFIGSDYHLPFGITLNLLFSSIDPPLDLKVGQVRFAAYLKDSDGYGLNYLLYRNNETDLYGKWIVCRVRQVPSRNRQLRPEPFGFTGPNIQEIERADRAAHIYNLEFSDDVERAFLQVALEAMRRKNTL